MTVRCDRELVESCATTPEESDHERAVLRQLFATGRNTWSSRFRVHHRIADAFRRGPVFLAGDAAHVHSPAGGQGMNTGIQNAMLLGRLLTGVVTGRTGAEHLDAYDATRRPIATGVVMMTHRMTRAATARNPVVRAVRNTAMTIAGKLPPVRRSLAMTLSELSTDTTRGARQ